MPPARARRRVSALIGALVFGLASVAFGDAFPLEVPHEYVVDDQEATTRQQQQAAVDGAVLQGNMAVVRLLVSDEATARRWLRATEETDTPQVARHSAALIGMDEADTLALYVAATGRAWEEATGLPVFAYGHHGALLRLPAPMVSAIGRTQLSPQVLDHVNEIATILRGRPKSENDIKLSLTDLRAVVGACQRAQGRPVFLHISE